MSSRSGMIKCLQNFVLHAPRQTGKTSCLLALMEYLNTQGHYRCVYAMTNAPAISRGA